MTGPNVALVHSHFRSLIAKASRKPCQLLVSIGDSRPVNSLKSATAEDSRWTRSVRIDWHQHAKTALVV